MLMAEEQVREQEDFVSIYLPLETEHGFRVKKNRLVAHILFGQKLGARLLRFGFSASHALFLDALYAMVSFFLMKSFYVETSDNIIWWMGGVQFYIWFFVWMPVHVDIGWQMLATFELWYLAFSFLSLFCFLIPLSVGWGARSFCSVMHGVGATGAFFADTMPPIASECMRLGWFVFTLICITWSVGYEFGLLEAEYRPTVEWAGETWDIGGHIMGRCAVLGVFGCRYVFCYLVWPRDTLYFKLSLSRSDQNERFVLLRELGLLPMGSHRPFWSKSEATQEDFRSAAKRSSANHPLRGSSMSTTLTGESLAVLGRAGNIRLQAVRRAREQFESEHDVQAGVARLDSTGSMADSQDSRPTAKTKTRKEGRALSRPVSFRGGSMFFV